MTTELHVAQVAFMRPLIDSLTEAGAPIDRLLRMAGLDRFRIDDPECYVPLERMHAFFDVVSSSQTGTQFPKLFASRYRLQNIGNWGLFFATCPDLLTACMCSARPDAKPFTHEGVRVDVSSTTTKYCDWLITRPSAARTQTEQLLLILSLDALRMAGGPGYVPLEIHLTGDSVDELEYILPLDRTVVKFNQAEFGVVFPTEMLAAPIRNGGLRSENFNPMARSDESAASRIERVLDASRASLIPTLDGIANVTGLSPRSLQRRLAEEGTSFSSVVEQWRFKTAVRHLGNARLTVREIGQELRYGHSSDFVRAFRRWTGTTPQRYSDDLALNQ